MPIVRLLFELPDITIDDIQEEVEDDTLNSVLEQLYTQIKDSFKVRLDYRKRYTDDSEVCEYCNETFDNYRGLNMHITKKHPEIKKDANLFLTAHRVNNSNQNYIYFTLDQLIMGKWKSHKIFKIKLTKDINNE